MENLGKTLIILILLFIILESNSNKYNFINPAFNIAAEKDTVHFDIFLNKFIESFNNGKTVNRFIAKEVCLTKPSILSGQTDIMPSLESGLIKKTQVIILLKNALTSERITRLKNKSKWIINSNEVVIYESFYCQDCPDEVFSYYWVFRRIKEQYILVKIYNNDYDSKCG